MRPSLSGSFIDLFLRFGFGSEADRSVHFFRRLQKVVEAPVQIFLGNLVQLVAEFVDAFVAVDEFAVVIDVKNDF